MDDVFSGNISSQCHMKDASNDSEITDILIFQVYSRTEKERRNKVYYWLKLTISLSAVILKLWCQTQLHRGAKIKSLVQAKEQFQ